MAAWLSSAGISHHDLLPHIPWIVFPQSTAALALPHELSGSPFPSPGDRPDPGIKPASPVAPALVGGLFTTEPPGKPHVAYAVFL